MRYIKVFEDDKEYIEIYSRIDSREFIKVEDNILDKLLLIFSHFSCEIITPRKGHINYQKSNNFNYIFMNDTKLDIYIHKLKDDYYYLQFFNSKGKVKYYKCDQFNGLKSCINYLIK